MLISPTTFFIFRVIAGIILFAGCFYLIKEHLESTKKTVISIIAGVIGFTVIQFAFSKVYVIDSDLLYAESYLFGTMKQQMGNGKNTTFSAGNFNKVKVINTSEFKLVLEEITYTNNANSVSSNGDYVILPHASVEVFLPGNEISYFFNQNIPDAVEAHGSSKTQYWLRLESQAGDNEPMDD